jgi:Flp pilus assembly protein TadG
MTAAGVSAPVTTTVIGMLDVFRKKIAGSTRRFLRRQDGAAAVEFGMVALPFFGLLFAILETALVFFAGQSLEAAVAEAARQVMTGQVQNAGYSQADYKKNVVCAYLASGVSMFDCTNGIYVSVQTYTTFGAATTSAPITNGKLDTTNLPYKTGGPGDIVVVQLYYQWPIIVSLLGNDLSNLGANRLLVATSVFRNEPYK